MLYLTDNQKLSFRFPEVHEQARLTITLLRTLRVPDDGNDYPLPAGLGCFPVRHLEDFAPRVPATWLKRGGVMIPMYQSEALWVNFETTYVADQGTYPFAIKVGTGKINAVTGSSWAEGLTRGPQDYVVAPKQESLDGYATGKDIVRQFVAMPLGKGYSVEEQITQSDQWGGLQVQVYPMKREVFEKRFPVKPPLARFSLSNDYSRNTFDDFTSAIKKVQAGRGSTTKPDMGVAPGGRIRQQIFADDFESTDWDLAQTSRCFIHLCNSALWKSLTGENPPTPPLTQRDYQQAGLPWFNAFKEKAQTLTGSAKLASLETVADHAQTIGDPPLKDNSSLIPQFVLDLWGGSKRKQ